ncbi:MAG TPA: transporter, partial [Gemmatimonadaceae bacterium]|nr:transporter [Gemmatimonadaceae bacterium]
MPPVRPLSRLLVLPALLLAGACAFPRAGEVDPAPIVTDRPDFTESAVTVPHRSTQVEMGGTWSREQGVRSVSSGETLVRHGLSPKVELRLTGASYAIERSAVARSQGLEDSGIGLKLALHDGGDAPALVPTLG